MPVETEVFTAYTEGVPTPGLLGTILESAMTTWEMNPQGLCLAHTGHR